MTATEWQVAGESKVLHVIDTAKTAPRRSGARSACGRYPQRNDFAWFSLSTDDPGVRGAATHYMLTFCGDCTDILTPGHVPGESSGTG